MMKRINLVKNIFKTPHIPLLTFLLLLSFVYWVASVTSFPINPDSGYYLTAGKYILEGLAPYRDFPVAYSPGIFYIFSIAELFGSKFGEVHKLLIYSIHIFNGVLLAYIIFKLDFSKNLAFTGGSLLILASFCLDGQAIILEPFQVVFILISLLAAITLTGFKSAILAGLFFGCALMSKQTSMFSLPVIALLIAFPAWFKPSVNRDTIKTLISRIIIFGISISLPCLLFCLFTQQSFITILVQLATFGGRAQGYTAQEYGIYDVVENFVSISGNGGERILMPMVVASFLLLTISKNNLSKLFIVGLLLNLTTILFVRGYPHYIQLLTPWGILIFISLIKELNLKSKQLESVFITFMLIPLISPVINTAHRLRIQFSEAPLSKQQILSDEINKHVTDGVNTIVVGHPWLYYTSNITPPNYNLGFIVTLEEIERRSLQAEQIIVMPKYLEKFELAQSKNSSIAKFTVTAKLNYDGSQVTIYK